MDARPEDTEDTVLRPRAPATSAPSGALDSDDTIIRLVEPAAARTGSIDLGALTAPVPAAPIPAAPMPVASTERAPVTAGTGSWAMRVRGTTTVVPLDVPAIIGRRPGALRPTEHPAPRRVVIPATYADVSSRHARIEQLGDSLVVADLGSTNGVVVHWSSGSRLRLRPGESCAVLPDAIVVLGAGVEIEFVDPTTTIPPHPSEPS